MAGPTRSCWNPQTPTVRPRNSLALFPALYPNDAVLRTALRGAATYGLSWFDAHLWAYAEVHGIGELLSEDFTDCRMYGTVMVRNPFAGPDGD